MWPVIPRNIFGPSFWDDQPDILDVAFRSPFEGTLINNLLGVPNKDIYSIKVHVGHYNTDDVKLKIQGDKLMVTGRHKHETKYGEDRSEFEREFDLPKDVLRDTLRHYITADGVLVIEGKKHVDVRYPFQDQSDRDMFRVLVDVQGFKPNDVNVSIHEKNLIIEALHKCETNTDKCRKEECRSFKKVVQLPNDIDEGTFNVVRRKDNYMIIEAKRNPNKALEGARRLSIKNE